MSERQKKVSKWAILVLFVNNEKKSPLDAFMLVCYICSIILILTVPNLAMQAIPFNVVCTIWMSFFVPYARHWQLFAIGFWWLTSGLIIGLRLDILTY